MNAAMRVAMAVILVMAVILALALIEGTVVLAVRAVIGR